MTVINVIIKGIIIPEVSDFRYGQQLQEQRFFELKFRQPLFGSPLSFGSDDAESYHNQPITLNFEGAFGKQEPVSGTIVKLEFINSPGQQAEVIVTGTIYRPSRSLSKFTLFIFALLVVPFLYIGGLFWYVSRLEATLVKTEGKVNFFQERTGKGTYRYTFKIAPYRTSFNRNYHTPVFNTATEHIDDLFKADDGTYEANRTGQPVVFYIFQSDSTKLNNPREHVDFFYLKSPTQQFVKFDYYYDVLVYVTDKTWFFCTWIPYMLIEVFCFICAFFCYKMYALNQQRKNKIIWLACIVLAVLLNVIVMSIII